MERMKTLFTYAVLILVFFIFSDVMANIAIKTTYKIMDTYLTQSKQVEVTIEKAKATFVNGYLEGKMTNTSGETIHDKYLKIQVFSKRGVELGTKYVEVSNLEQQQTREFKMGFRFTNAKYTKVSLVDKKEEIVEDKQLVSEELQGARLLATVILLCYL